MMMIILWCISFYDCLRKRFLHSFACGSLHSCMQPAQASPPPSLRLFLRSPCSRRYWHAVLQLGPNSFDHILAWNLQANSFAVQNLEQFVQPQSWMAYMDE